MKKWQPNFSHFITLLKISFTDESQLKYNSNTSYNNIAVMILYKIKNLNNLAAESLKNSKFTSISSASLPAVRPTSGRRIGSVISCNACRILTCYHRSVIRLRFIHCAIVSPFMLYCFSFFLTGERNIKKSLNRCWWIEHIILNTSY